MEEIQPIAEMEFKPRELFTYLPPVRPVDIEFHNLTYTVSCGRRKGKKDILKGIDGRFQAGELTAILGPSGSGKTSLLNILTGFRTVGAMGSVKTNGTERSLADFKKMSCYILQDDQLHSFLTVDEVMTIAADLKLGNNLTSTEKQLAIKDILDILGLSHCKNTPSGSLSGGQKKRLSIALEMVKNPAIMFLDEPTTGLDSQSCTQCVSMLKTLARGGRTIICTIHSPSASVYEMFDHVYVMAEGNCVYQGSSNNTISFLDYVGLSCPQYHNPADFIIEISCGEYGDHTKSMVALSDNGKSFLWRKNRRKDSPQISSRPKKKSFSKRNSIVNKLFREKFSPDNMAATSEWTQFILLLKRNFVQAHRDWMSTYLRILIHLVVGGVIGLLYTEAGAEGSKTLSNFGYFMVCLTYLMYTAMMPAILKFPSELPILVKEHFNNWYSLRSYYMAFLAVDTPFQIIFCTVYTVMSYFISSQPLDISRFSMFLSITLMVCLVAESIGLILGSVVNIVNGTFLGTILAAPMLLFAGFVIPFADMPSYLSWFSYITYIRYGLEGLTVAIYGYGRETLSCVKRYCHFRYPAKVLKEIGMEQSKYWVDIVVLISILCCLRFVAYWCLRRKIRNVR